MKPRLSCALALAVLATLPACGPSGRLEPPAARAAAPATRAAAPATKDLGLVGVSALLAQLDCPCPELALTLPVGAAADGWLDVRARFDGTAVAAAGLRVSGPDGEHNGQRGFDAERVKWPEAPAGSYRISIAGSGRFELSAALRARSAPKAPGELRLPNIVTLVPEQIAFGSCDLVEQAEQGARRCLRLGNAIGNVGDGPLEVHLPWVEAAQGLAGEAQPLVDGVFAQRIYRWDGSARDRLVGASDFHPAHAHWHYDGFATFRLYAVDPATGLRGAEVGAGHKSGFCFLDWGRMGEGEAQPEAGGRAQQDCLVPMAEGWTMGISADWMDFYWSALTDQYVEASGVDDGLYELVSLADPDDWLEEVDETDNAASVLLTIHGDDIRIIERRGWYRIPPGTNNL